jgi:hypothetical protein
MTAFDSARNRLVVFSWGQTVGSNCGNSTWEWDGDVWHKVIPTGDLPDRRFHAGLVYDPEREVVVLFGGQSCELDNPFFDDTWEYDGTTWSLIEPTDPEDDGNPSARHSHRLVYDAARHRTMMIGGLGPDNKYSDNDTNGSFWAWDGVSWQKLVMTDPEDDGNPDVLGYDYSFRGYVGDYHAARQSVVLVGRIETGVAEGIWEYNGTSWRHHVPVDPTGDGSPDYDNGRDAAYHAGREALMAIGGKDHGGNSGRTWFWEAGNHARPAVVVKLDLREAGIETSIITGMSTTWNAGGQGYPDGPGSPGVSLLQWKGNSWVAIDDHLGGIDTPLDLTWSTDENEAQTLPVGEARLLGFAVTTREPNGMSYAILQANYAEVTVSYRLSQ